MAGPESSVRLPSAHRRVRCPDEFVYDEVPAGDRASRSARTTLDQRAGQGSVQDTPRQSRKHLTTLGLSSAERFVSSC